MWPSRSAASMRSCPPSCVIWAGVIGGGGAAAPMGAGASPAQTSSRIINAALIAAASTGRSVLITPTLPRGVASPHAADEALELEQDLLPKEDVQHVGVAIVRVVDDESFVGLRGHGRRVPRVRDDDVDHLVRQSGLERHVGRQ